MIFLLLNVQLLNVTIQSLHIGLKLFIPLYQLLVGSMDLQGLLYFILMLLDLFLEFIYHILQLRDVSFMSLFLLGPCFFNLLQFFSMLCLKLFVEFLQL